MNKTYDINVSNLQKSELLISKTFEKGYFTVAEFYLEQVFLVAWFLANSNDLWMFVPLVCAVINVDNGSYGLCFILFTS